MRIKKTERAISLLLAIIMLLGMIPMSALPVSAAHRCPDCGDLIDGSPYCDECYRCDVCIDLCLECGTCTECSGSEICEGCSGEESGKMCEPCAIEKGTHCPGCDTCYLEVFIWCEDCGMCSDCIPYDEPCSITHGKHLCEDCAMEWGTHCFGCGTCYFDAGRWCGECGLCEDCAPYDDGCTGTLGFEICKECATYFGNHCPVCDACYFDVGEWCEACGQCYDCSNICAYCSEEAGAKICIECAISDGMHCPECSECYGDSGGDLCSECGICANCAEICVAEDICVDCALSNGTHCLGCESCGDDVAICEGCGEYCSDCAYEFCESCNLCGECVLLCSNCSSCEECAVICPGCEEYCSECEGICDDCGLCLVCCADIAFFEGCDCAEWVCVESTDWDEHFFNEHNDELTGGHSARPSAAWSSDDNYHWHECAYCDSTSHITYKAAHDYDSNGKCKICSFVKNAKIQIVVQPKDSKNTLTRSPDEDYDESNIATFSVKAVGNSELTYTWYWGYYNYSFGKIKYYLFEGDIEEGECYEGPELSVLVPTDNCVRECYVHCVITDKEGNEVQTRDALLSSRHNYQYFKYYKTNKNPCDLAQRSVYGHILECVGEECDKLTHLLPHEDADENSYCDICNFELGKILIRRQPKFTGSVYVYGPLEDYDESNFAHLSVDAVGGDGELTYTWCERKNVGGRLSYVPMEDPLEGEDFTGPEIDFLLPMDACCRSYTYACFITDEAGNEIKTVDVVINAKHNYQYFKQYHSLENPYADVRRQPNGHILKCVGDGCEKFSKLQIHRDENKDFCCDICAYMEKIGEIEIEITMPREGKKPNYSVYCESTVYGPYSTNTKYRRWYVSDNGTDGWALMDKDTVFVAGKYYKFELDVKTVKGRIFDTYEQKPGYFIPKVFDSSNGIYGWGKRLEGEDPSLCMTMEYKCGICPERLVKNVRIEDIEVPKGGMTPSYNAKVYGEGYMLEEGESRDHWTGLLYRRNGVAWYDYNGNLMYEDSVFEPLKSYTVVIYLDICDWDSFEFDWNIDSGTNVTGTVNGFSAKVVEEGVNSLYNHKVSYTFISDKAEVSEIHISGLDDAVAGAHPDTTVSIDGFNDKICSVNVTWYEYYGDGSYGGAIMGNDTFEEDMTYRAEIVVKPKKSGQNADVCSFVLPLKAVTVDSCAPAELVGGSKALYIYKECTTRSNKTYSVSGKVTSAGSASANITLQLIPKGYSEPAYETVVKGNSTEYNFAAVLKGDYTLRVTKSGHRTKEIAVAVTDSNQIVNITLSEIGNVILGDINADGAVNGKDSNLLSRAVKGLLEYEEDSYEFKAADIDGDEAISAKDSNLIQRIVRGMLKL